MAYIDFDFYAGTFGGTKATGTNFASLEARSRLQIDRHTFNRVRRAKEADPSFSVPEDIKLAQCSIIDYLHDFDQNGGRVAQSETVGKYSTTYAGVKTFDEGIRDIVKTYLGGTPWTYMGGDSDIVY